MNALHKAVADNNVEAVAEILKGDGGDEINSKTSSYLEQTALHIAAENDFVDVARMLVEAGADISVQDKSGRLPAHWARSVEMMDLVTNEHNVHCEDNAGLTPLEICIENDNVDICKLLVVKKKTNLDVAPFLHQASRKGRDEIVKILLENGADPNKQDADGLTPLHYVKNTSIAAMLLDSGAALLLDSGAALLLDSGAEMSPLAAACDIGNRKVFDFLIERGAVDRTAVFYARDLEMCKKLLETGQDIDALNKEKNTPLLHACIHHEIDIVKLLLHAGSDPYVKNRDGLNALHIAVYEYRFDLVEYLVVERKMDASVLTDDGRSARFIASVIRAKHIENFLAEHGG